MWYKVRVEELIRHEHKKLGDFNMSSDGMHVHGPHDHELEHAASHGGKDSFAGRVAVATAILATIGAMMSYEGGATQADAMLSKNQAAIRKTEASNQWNFYQAKSQKQNLAELGRELSDGEAKKGDFDKKAKRYEFEKESIKKEAERLESLSEQADNRSDVKMHEHHRWAQATTLLQVAIALSAIALLTRKRWLLWGVAAVSMGGIALGCAAFFGA